MTTFRIDLDETSSLSNQIAPEFTAAPTPMQRVQNIDVVAVENPMWRPHRISTGNLFQHPEVKSNFGHVLGEAAWRPENPQRPQHCFQTLEKYHSRATSRRVTLRSPRESRSSLVAHEVRGEK